MRGERPFQTLLLVLRDLSCALPRRQKQLDIARHTQHESSRALQPQDPLDTLRDLSRPEREPMRAQERHEESHKLNLSEFAAQAGARAFRKRHERALGVRGHALDVGEQLRVGVDIVRWVPEVGRFA